MSHSWRFWDRIEKDRDACDASAHTRILVSAGVRFLDHSSNSLTNVHADQSQPVSVLRSQWIAGLFSGRIIDLTDRPIGSRAERRLRTLRKQCWRCWYCGEFTPLDGAHLDHQEPKSRGGKRSRGNLVAACVSWNCTKGDKTVDEFRAYASPSGGLFWGEKSGKN